MRRMRPDGPLESRRPADLPARLPRRAGLGILLVLIALAACSGGGTSAPAATSGATSAAQSGAPASAPAAAPASPAASTGSGPGTGAIPSDQCSVVTKADVEAAYGGSSSVGKLDENGHCAFDVSGAIHAGPASAVSGSVVVSFNDAFTVYDRAKMLFGDAVVKVDGLGTDAWFGLTALHVKIAGGELVVAGMWVGDFDRTILQKDTVTLAKAILPHL